MKMPTPLAIHLFFVGLLVFLTLEISAVEESIEQKKIVWFLGGHMQDLFEEEYLKPMLSSGYNLMPMHDLKRKAAKAGFDLRMGDPNATKLAPFSHERSGIPEVAQKKTKASGTQTEVALKEFEYIIVFEVMSHQLNYLKNYPKDKLILFLWEPPSVMPQNYDSANHAPFSKVYTWNDQLVDNQKYFKFHYPVLQPMIKDVIPFESKKLCTMIAGNRSSAYPTELYTARRNMIAFFESHHPTDFDLYGKWWPASYKTYKGSIDNKINRLKYYKFSIAYENVKDIPGYITEKIFDSFQAGCVPVYLGASNVHAYIPKNCFIDGNDFADEAALYAFMKNMSEEQYALYIKNIQTYLSSPQAHLFSSAHFVDTVMDILKPAH